MFNHSKIKRNKALVILLLPILACVFLIGWLMYWTGEPKGKIKSKTEHVTVGAIVLEEDGKVRVH